MKFATLAFLGVVAASAKTDTPGGLGDGVYLTTEVDGKIQYELLPTPKTATTPQIRGRGIDISARSDRSFACTGVNLNDNELYQALHSLAGVFGSSYTLTNPSISSVYGGVKVFVCNYNGNAGSGWSSSKLWGKNTDVNNNCGKDIAGHINEPRGEGNYGRTFATDHFC